MIVNQSGETTIDTNNHANEPTIDELGQRYLQAKDDLFNAKQALTAIEETITELLGHKPEGVTHFPGEAIDISTTGVMNRSLEKDCIHRLQAALDPAVFATVIDVQPKLNIKELKSLATLDPDSYTKLSEFVTSKPGKTKVTVKII